MKKWGALFLAGHLHAECPEWTQDPSIPLCPQGGANILSDEYPAIGYLIDEQLEKEVTQAIEDFSKDRPPHFVQSYKIRGGEWMQDFFEAFYDPKKGTPILRMTRRPPLISEEAQNRLKAVADALKDCGVKIGDPLKSQQKGNWGAQAGGNIEGLPGGLCMRGNSQNDEYAQQYCKAENQVVVDSKWLFVGHVDEMLNVIQANSEPCEYWVQYGSPAKAT